MHPRNSAPNHARLAPGDRLLGAIHVRNALAQVEAGVLRGRDIFDLEEGNKRVLEVLATLVAEMASLGVEPAHGMSGWMVRRRAGVPDVVIVCRVHLDVAAPRSRRFLIKDLPPWLAMSNEAPSIADIISVLELA